MPRLTVVTLGVRDLARATAFYTAVFGVNPKPEVEGVSFFELRGTWISLFPIENLAKDIGLEVAVPARGFNGITLAHNARSRDEVISIIVEAEAAGATIVKPPHDTFWGGFSGYFADLDGYHWEVPWGPMFDFHDDGTLKFK
ncbi:MAG: putative lactoylglutathione lyase [Verrucomicrobiaceae bacterium]|nr:putative lactoylglutathione lyase [Verrucomicrobiaceae bacterium]